MTKVLQFKPRRASETAEFPPLNFEGFGEIRIPPGFSGEELFLVNVVGDNDRGHDLLDGDRLLCQMAGAADGAPFIIVQSDAGFLTIKCSAPACCDALEPWQRIVGRAVQLIRTYKPAETVEKGGAA
jgi:hypothetical protein